MPSEQVIIEFIPDLSQMTSAEERLTALGAIDQKSAIIFKATNDQLKARQGITNDIASASTKQEAVVGKLTASLKSLSGESKEAVQNLLKLSTDELTTGFKLLGVSVEEYINSLKKAGSASKLTPVNNDLKVQDILFGKLTLSVTKEQAAVNKLVSSLKGLTGESKSSVESLLKLSTSEIADTFQGLGVSVDEYIAALSKTGGVTETTTTSTVKLKTQLRAMTEELTRLKLAGQENTDQYKKLAAEAGNLSDTIGDVSAEVKRLGSDTNVFDGLISGVQGLAGGFAVVQGASALFGDQSEDLQEVLLRVSAAMAVLQGLQQVQNVFQKESAASLLILNIQRGVTNAQIAIENGLQSRSIIVRLGAAAAQRVLNAAMAVNPIGLVVVALTTLIGLVVYFSSKAREAATAQDDLNRSLKSASEFLEADIEGIKKATDRRVADLESSGAKQSKVLRANAEAEVLITKRKQDEIIKLEQSIRRNRNSTNEDVLADVEKNNQKLEQLQTEVSDSLFDIEQKNREGRRRILQEGLQDAIDIRQAEIDKILALGGENTPKEFAARKELLKATAALEIQNAGENAVKIMAIRTKLNLDLHQVNLKAREEEQKDSLSALQTELVKRQEASKAINERESQSEIDIRKSIIFTTARFEAEQEGLSQKQRTEIRVRALQEAAQLQKDFNKKSNEETLQDYISANNVLLQNINLSEREKLDLKETNIIAAAEIELEQNKGLASKIKEINAKRDADIKAVRLQSIQDTVAFELRVFETGFAAQNREIEKQLAAQDQLRSAPNGKERKRLEDLLGVRRLSLQQENELIDEQTRHGLDAIELQKNALKSSLRQKLISQQEYTQSYAELNEKETQIFNDGEDKKRKSALETAEYQKKLDKQRIDLAIEVAGQVSGVLGNLNDLQSTRDNQNIAEQKQKLEDLKAAGSITEKEAVLRLKKIDDEEKKIKYQAAVRDKQLAIFNAVIATAAGIAKASPVVPLMALAGAIGAAQIAIIAARPIPKFGKGKKDRYQGLAQVGETGSEIIESKGRMYITTKPTIVWLGAKDKVYNPKETKSMLSRELPSVNKENMANGNNKSDTRPEPLDYDKLGKAIGKHTSMTMNVDGYRIFIKEQQSFITYLNNRNGY